MCCFLSKHVSVCVVIVLQTVGSACFVESSKKARVHVDFHVYKAIKTAKQLPQSCSKIVDRNLRSILSSAPCLLPLRDATLARSISKTKGSLRKHGNRARGHTRWICESTGPVLAVGIELINVKVPPVYWPISK